MISLTRITHIMPMIGRVASAKRRLLLEVIKDNAALRIGFARMLPRRR
jgi:hypothetical protein